MRNADSIRLLSYARLVEEHQPDLVLMQEGGPRLDALKASLSGNYERCQIRTASTVRPLGADTHSSRKNA